MDSYTQCYLAKANKRHIAWIPTKYAIINKIIKIELDGVWDNGWKVVEVYNTQSSKHTENHERDYLKQRSASDI